MFCVKALRELRNKKSQHSALAASDCWGNVSVLVGMTARACGFSSDTTLCKKHIDESNNVNKVSCCFPFHGPENACKGALVLCPQCLFSVFDETKTVHHTGTMICEGSLLIWMSFFLFENPARQEKMAYFQYKRRVHVFVNL